jgi:ATP-binding cassette subfamily C protein LapB
LSLATRVIALEGGSVIADGPRNEVLAELQKRGNGAKNA